jgi:hypothetical protein
MRGFDQLTQSTISRKQTVLMALMERRSPAPFKRERFSGVAGVASAPGFFCIQLGVMIFF